MSKLRSAKFAKAVLVTESNAQSCKIVVSNYHETWTILHLRSHSWYIQMNLPSSRRFQHQEVFTFKCIR
jgi:hypothetical protein